MPRTPLDEMLPQSAVAKAMQASGGNSMNFIEKYGGLSVLFIP